MYFVFEIFCNIYNLLYLFLSGNLIKKAILLSGNIMNGDFGQLFKIYNELPTIHQCVICVQLPILRKYIKNILHLVCFFFII